MLAANICEELDEKVVVLLSGAPFAVVGSCILELDALECGFDSGLVGVLVEALRVVEAATRAERRVSSIHAVGGGWSWCERYPCGLFLRTFVSFRCVLNKLDGFAIPAVHNCCYRHGEAVHLWAGTVMLYEVHGSVWDVGLQRIRAVQREVIAAVARPVVVGHEKAFVDAAEYLGLDDLPIGGLKVVHHIRSE